MPRKRQSRSPPTDKRSRERDDLEDDDFLFDDTQSNSGRNGQEPIHRNAANARERARMRVLSKAFCRLKTTLPWVPADTKLSKLDTLRLAASYIAHLRALLHEPSSSHTPPHPLSLAWPFAFQHGGSLACGVSQRWSLSQTDTASINNRNSDQNQREHHPSRSNHTEGYGQDYAETDYERNYDEVMNNDNQMQYTYGYKQSYYEMRNSYSTDSLINNV